MEEKYLEILRHYVNPNDCKIVIQMLLDLHSVIGCFPTDREIDVLSYEHSDDMDLRPNTYQSYKDGMEDCIELIKRKHNKNNKL